MMVRMNNVSLGAHHTLMTHNVNTKQITNYIFVYNAAKQIQFETQAKRQSPHLFDWSSDLNVS